MSFLSEIENEIYREVRDLRDMLRGKTEDVAEEEIKRRVQKFWRGQPFWVQFFRKPLMRFAYRMYHDTIL